MSFARNQPNPHVLHGYTRYSCQRHRREGNLLLPIPREPAQYFRQKAKSPLHQKSKVDDPLAEGLIPSRGVIEIKPPSDDAHKVAQSEQVAKYVAKYGLVLVTTLRQFVIVARIDGKPKELES